MLCTKVSPVSTAPRTGAPKPETSQIWSPRDRVSISLLIGRLKERSPWTLRTVNWFSQSVTFVPSHPTSAPTFTNLHSTISDQSSQWVVSRRVESRRGRGTMVPCPEDSVRSPNPSKHPQKKHYLSLRDPSGGGVPNHSRGPGVLSRV